MRRWDDLPEIGVACSIFQGSGKGQLRRKGGGLGRSLQVENGRWCLLRY